MPRVSASEREATRRRLIEAGKQEFAERGLAGARFDEISLAAGHAKGTIYNYFDSKEALFFTIVDEWCEKLIDAFVMPDDASARDQLLAIASIDVEIARKDRDLARVVVQQMPALLGSHSESTLAAIGPGVDLLSSIFDHGIASGEFCSPHPAPVLARLFLNAMSAYEMEALMPDPILLLDDVVDLLDRHFLKGLS
jgi:AcrR family transcriptional regulator